MVEEVIVTAQKRSETLQNVPMSITAVTGQQLERRGVMNFEDLASGVPSLAFRSAGPGRQQLELRGISSNAGISSTVGYYLDDLAISGASSDSETSYQQSNLDPDLFDIERVEILRGPQGTLYGSGAMGGAVRILTKQPVLGRFTADVKADTSYTDHGGLNGEVKGMVNIPIGDRVALRLVGSYRDYDGYINRLVGNFDAGGAITGPAATPGDPGATPLSGVTLPNRLGTGPIRTYKGVNTEKVLGLRGALRFQINPDFYVQPGVFYQKIDQGGKNSYDSVPGTLDQRRPFNISEPYADEFEIYDLTAKYDFHKFTVLSATGYAHRQISNTEDWSDAMTYFFGYYNLNDANFLPAQRVLANGSLASVGDLFANSAFPATVQPYPAPIHENNRLDNFSEELRASSSGNGPLTWTVGAFYKHTTSDAQHRFDVPGYSATFPAYQQLGVAVFGSGGWPWGDLLAYNQIRNHISEESVFGQADYKILDNVTLTVGGRYFGYSSSFVRNNDGLFYGGGSALTGVPLTGSSSGTGFTPKVLLSYKPVPASELYFSAAEGFRIGGASSPIPVSRCAQDLAAIGLTNPPSTYRPDSLWSYELGSKNRLFDNRLTLNASVYDIEWSQVQQRISLPNCGFSFTANAGNARSRGAEVESVARLNSWLNLSGGFGYTDATITSSAPGTGIKPGAPLLDVPKWTANVAVDTNFSVAGTDDTFRVQWNYVGDRLDDYSEPVKPSYSLVGARLTLRNKSPWEATLYVDNLLDTRPVLTRIDTLGQIWSTFRRVETLRPRTIGISFQRSFGN
ncbi:TonB-dependent receptor [Phenylobacterium montanum]|uniref:TonB-dependent receptor n=1 Tax=Phenylobacterium montanum TaxID=2823693 RepID=A0A975IWX5_9CAUL|nr:TonB-dependent receptor [Caulobacter sp. S6]QUD90300.1 TonB-dependent receptor [Caulobacter sp. S6]